MAKKQSKVKIEAIVADKAEPKDQFFSKQEHSGPKEDIKKYLKRKLTTFGKYKQTSVVILNQAYDPVRCSICGKINFFVADISFVDDYTNKDFKIKQVCSLCLSEAKVINFTPKELSNYCLNNKIDPVVTGEPFVGTCSKCGCKSPVVPFWIYVQEMPLKICLCDPCRPLPQALDPIKPVVVLPMIEKISESKLDSEDLKGW